MQRNAKTTTSISRVEEINVYLRNIKRHLLGASDLKYLAHLERIFETCSVLAEDEYDWLRSKKHALDAAAHRTQFYDIAERTDAKLNTVFNPI